MAEKPAAKKTAKNSAPAASPKAEEPVKRKSNLPERPKYKFGVAELADRLDLEPASVRVALRKAGVEKAPGGVYGWDSKDEFEEVVQELRPEKKAKPEKTKKAA